MDVQGYIINQAGSELALAALVEASTLPTFQDTWLLDAWGMHGSGKDDILVYSTSGILSTHFIAFQEPSSDLSTPEGFQNMKEAILNAQ